MGSARRGMACDCLGALAVWQARVFSTPWQRLPLFSLLLPTCLLIPRRKQGTELTCTSLRSGDPWGGGGGGVNHQESEEVLRISQLPPTPT